MQNNECRQLAHLITYKDMAKYEYNNATFFITRFALILAGKHA